jgi:hypothetical protein
MRRGNSSRFFIVCEELSNLQNSHYEFRSRPLGVEKGVRQFNAWAIHVASCSDQLLNILLTHMSQDTRYLSACTNINKVVFLIAENLPRASFVSPNRDFR